MNEPLHPHYALIIYRDDIPAIVSGGSNVESLEEYGSHLVQDMRDEGPAWILPWDEAVKIAGDPRRK